MNAVPTARGQLAGSDRAAPGERRFQVEAVDPASFSTHRVSPIRHNFDEHPLMELSQLELLAKELVKTKQCRFIMPGTAQSAAFDHKPVASDGRSIEEVFRRIEEPGSWVALYNVETDPRYRGFVQEVARTAADLIEPQEPGIFNVGGFIFISAPPSVTPFHLDRENNLWLQVRGRKTMNVWDNTDRHVAKSSDVDEFILYASLENIRLKDGYRERSHELDVGPGDGVYFPTTSPHMTRTEGAWAKPGDGVSISIGVVFYSEHTRMRAYAHAWNHFLRQFRIEPRPIGESHGLDKLKSAFGRLYVGFKKNVRGYKLRVGM